MTINFGLQLDDAAFPLPTRTTGGVVNLGPQGLLHTLEDLLGLGGYPSKNEHLRIEQYRQALQACLDQEEEAFFKRSFEADQLGCATALLNMRDELRLAGWSFEPTDDLPKRLKSIAGIEQQLKNMEQQLLPGFADRFCAVLQFLPDRDQQIEQLFLNEPEALLPDHFQRLFKILRKKGVSVSPLPETTITGDSDLSQLKKIIARQSDSTGPVALKGDGSLIVLQAERETEAAAFIAKLIKHNPEYRPLCVIPEKNRALDNTLIQEGLPSMGILSSSNARPSLQILKLVTTFLWRPINPFKILEFVSLAVKPLDDELATLIAGLMARQPGINGESWFIAIRRFFEDLELRANFDRSIDVIKIREQYDFWFDRPRFDANGGVPKQEAIAVFSYLDNWAFEEFEQKDRKNPSFMVLSEQAKRVRDLLETLPDSQNLLSQLELERIVRTIYEPPPVLFREKEVGHLPAIYHSSALIGATDKVLWWNFVRNEPTHFFSKWYKKELNYLNQAGLSIQSPQAQNKLQLWQAPRAIQHCTQQLLLVIPKKVNGTEVYPHALHDEMVAAFGSLDAISFQINNWKNDAFISRYFQLPSRQHLSIQKLGKVNPFLKIRQPEKLEQREHETLTSLESLFYYPYQYVFRHKIKLRKSSILSIVGNNTLMGNLAHRFFEMILKEKVERWDKEGVYNWIEEKAPRLLRREGAVLLMYGREPERIAFINRVKYAAWSLISLIQNNGWTVSATEKPLEGQFASIPVKAKADVVLERGSEKAVIDLKWRGASRREQIIRNEEDLQLVMYSRLVCGGADEWAHTAYFIIESGKMIARNQAAFKEIAPLVPDASADQISQRIWDRMATTFNWRSDQLKEGLIEVRTNSTLHDIEDRYAENENLMDILEMKSGDAPFDDYQTLINLID